MTRWADDCLVHLGATLPHGRVPRIKALHLPPEPPAGESRGEFCALELEDGTLGLTFVMLDDTLDRLRQAPELAHLPGDDAWDVAQGLSGPASLRRTLGLAAVNALSRWIFDRAGWAPAPSSDSVGSLDLGSGDHLGMIGLFTPLLGRVLDSGARLTVVELQERLAGTFEGYRVTLDASALGACNKVLATGSLLLNDTLDDMLSRCRQAVALALLGPTVGCLPDALFARGVTALGGTWVLDGRAYLDALQTGQPRREASRKSTILPSDYPGRAALAQRLR